MTRDELRLAIENSGFAPAIRSMLWLLLAHVDDDPAGLAVITDVDVPGASGYAESTTAGYLRTLLRTGWITVVDADTIALHPPAEALDGPMTYRAPKTKISKRRRQLVYERDGYRCVACESPEDITIDHELPRKYGGTNDIDNLRVMCRPCNSSKGATALMTWFKVDDSFYDHPKVFDAPDGAVALWTRAGCWSARNLTDGFVPAKLPARLCDDPDTAIKELVERGLWSRAKGGYQFHDWTVYQPSAARVKATRAVRAEAGSRGGKAKAAKQTASKLLDAGQEIAKQISAPSRPGPTRPPKRASASPSRAARQADHDNEALPGMPPVSAKTESENQRINRLTTTYTDRLPLSSFKAVQGVVRTAVRSDSYTDAQILAGLSRLADEPGRAVTATTLRIAIEGSTRPGHQPYRDFTPDEYLNGDL